MSIKHTNGVTCVLSCDGRCAMRHKAQKPLGSGRYSTGQKHCQVCETFIECDGIFCPCCEHKLRTRRTNRECKTTKFDSTVLIYSEKANLVCNSTARCVDHRRSKSNIKDPVVQGSYEKALMHEHDLSVIADNKNIARCLTCNVYFCGLCGKALGYAQIYTDLRNNEREP